VNDSGDTWDQAKPIQGVYKRQLTNVGPNNSAQYVIDTTDGEVAVWGSTVLDNKFESVPVGSEVRVEYLGMAKGKTGKEYKDYKVQYKPTQTSKVVEEFDGELI
jgi:spore coat protein U-like protein